MSFPFWMMGLPLMPWTLPPVRDRGYADDHILVVAVGGVVYFLNLNLVVFLFPGHAAADAGTTFFDVLTVTDRNCRVLYPA